MAFLYHLHSSIHYRKKSYFYSENIHIMDVQQFELRLPPFKRGYHIVTELIARELDALPKTGILHIFIKHTSAAITVNEAADPDVLVDFEYIFNKIVPENMPFLTHTIEGPDDMPAHIKAALIGNNVSIPITNGKMNLGAWQGIYLCEFRNGARSRNLTITIIGG